MGWFSATKLNLLLAAFVLLVLIYCHSLTYNEGIKSFGCLLKIDSMIIMEYPNDAVRTVGRRYTPVRIKVYLTLCGYD